MHFKGFWLSLLCTVKNTGLLSFSFFFTEDESGDSEDNEEEGSGSGGFEDEDPEIDRLFEKV